MTEKRGDRVSGFPLLRRRRRHRWTTLSINGARGLYRVAQSQGVQVLKSSLMLFLLGKEIRADHLGEAAVQIRAETIPIFLEPVPEPDPQTKRSITGAESTKVPAPLLVPADCSAGAGSTNGINSKE